MAIDCIYTLAAILSDVIIPFKKEILNVLKNCKFDKMKPVWEATVEAMTMLKEIGPPIEETESQTTASSKKKKVRKKRRDTFAEVKVSDLESERGSVCSQS